MNKVITENSKKPALSASKKPGQKSARTKIIPRSPALQESKLKRRRLFEMAGDAIMLMDQDKYIDCNKKALEILGRRKRQITGKRPFCFSPEFQPDGSESKTRAKNYMEAALNGKPQFFMWRHLRHDGTPFDAEMSLNLIKLKKQKFVQAIFRDVAWREFIEWNPAGYQKMLDRTKAIIWLVPLIDRQTGEFLKPSAMKIKFLNQSEEIIFGFTPEEYTKKFLADVLTGESFDYISQILADEIIKDKDHGVDPNRSLEMELQHYHKNGSIIDLSVSMKALRDDRGKIIGIQGISRDISTRKKVQRELEVSHERFRELAELLPGSVFECDKDFHVTFLNRKAISTFGYSENDVKRGLNILKALPSDDFIKVIEYVSRVLVDNSRSSYGIELTGIKKSGETIPIRLYGDIIYQNNKAVGLRGIAVDITDQKTKGDALRQSEERYRAIIENIEDGYYEVDLEGNLTYFNDAALRITGYSRAEMFGVNFRKFCDKEDGDCIFEAFHNVYITRLPLREMEWEIKGKNGEVHIGEISASLIKDASNKIVGFRGIMRDVTERRKAEELIKQLAYHDFLTGLPNRRLFNDRLNMALKYVDRNQSKLAIMMIDLDRFKEVNDKLGHQVGDLLLKAVGRLLSDSVRKSDTIARMGGDEFLMLLMTDISTHQDIASVAEKIIHAFEQPILCNGHNIKTTPSIGIAVYPDHGNDIESLIRNADAAMYLVKEGGRNSYRFYDFT